MAVAESQLVEQLNKAVQESIRNDSSQAQTENPGLRVYYEGRVRFWEFLLRNWEFEMDGTETVRQMARDAFDQTCADYGARSLPCKLGIISAYDEVEPLRAMFFKAWYGAQEHYQSVIDSISAPDTDNDAWEDEDDWEDDDDE